MRLIDADLFLDDLYRLDNENDFRHKIIETFADMVEMTAQKLEVKVPQWVPCSEKLPEEKDYRGCAECIDGAVWYYTDKGAMGLGYYYESTKSWSTTYDESPYGNVIAWMKLPEQYREEE